MSSSHTLKWQRTSSSDYGLAPEIVGVNWGMSDPIRLDHPPFDSYIEAEILATRVNERRCINGRHAATDGLLHEAAK